jgi:hypothetical protein
MSERTFPSKTELLSKIDAGWNELQSYLALLTYEQVVEPTDAAGWTAKDHLTHLAAWEDSVWAMLNYKPRAEYMGLTPEIWATEDYDVMNAVLREKYKEMTVPDLQKWFFGVHERLVDKVKAMPEEELMRPYHHYQPGAKWDLPAMHWVIIDTYEHYDEHKDYISRIVGEPTVTVEGLLNSIQKGWDKLNAYLGTLSEEQLTQRKDGGGWTVKDHAIHLAIWEDGMYALLERLMRVEYMGIDEATWETGDNDTINAVIQQRYKDLTWQDVQQKRQQIHQRLIDKIASMSDEDLMRPYRYYEFASMEDRPVVGWLVGNTFGHYDEHLPWIKAIAER